MQHRSTPLRFQEGRGDPGLARFTRGALFASLAGRALFAGLAGWAWRARRTGRAGAAGPAVATAGTFAAFAAAYRPVHRIVRKSVVEHGTPSFHIRNGVEAPLFRTSYVCFRGSLLFYAPGREKESTLPFFLNWMNV